VQCSQCVPGTSYRYPFAAHGACIPCPSTPAGVLAGYLAACSGVAGLVFALQHVGLPLAPLFLLVEFLQLLSLVGMIDVDWPHWFSRGLFPLATSAVGNLDLGAVGCVDVPGGQWGRWGLALLLPVSVVCTLLVVQWIAGAVERARMW
jgi:hypothetical protein